jgi:hypothetical protein
VVIQCEEETHRTFEKFQISEFKVFCSLSSAYLRTCFLDSIYERGDSILFSNFSNILSDYKASHLKRFYEHSFSHRPENFKSGKHRCPFLELTAGFWERSHISDRSNSDVCSHC